MISTGDRLSLTIEKPAAGGRMIARRDGRVLLVSGAIPGEQVTAVVERVNKGVMYARTVSIEQPSPDRRETAADPLCGGCLYAHVAYPRQLELKAALIADAFARIGRLHLPSPVRVASSPEEGYRMRARLHVRGPQIGFYREGTHDLCEPRQTGQLLMATCDVLERLGASLHASGLDSVREIELAENIDASDRVVQLDTAQPIELGVLERIGSTEGLTGLVSQSGAHGSAHVTDRLTIGSAETLSLRRHVRAFFQGNRYLLESLVSHVVEQVPEKSDVLDLYAGAGLFALSAAAARAATVTAVEGDRFAATDLMENAAGSDGAVTAVHEAVEAFTATNRTKAGCVIVDPPRTGMSREALDGVVRLRPPRLVYVSCDVATLARDARRLVDAGYAMIRAVRFDCFPTRRKV